MSVSESGGQEKTDGVIEQKIDVGFMELKKEKQRYKEELDSLKPKYQELESKIKDLELKKQQAEGDKDGVIETLKGQVNEYKNKFETASKTYAQKTLEDQIKTEAIKEGCVNPQKLMKLLTNEDLAKVEVGEGYKINEADLKTLIEKAKQDHADIGLFKKENVKVHDVTSNKTIPRQEFKVGDITSQLKEELEKRYKK